MSRDDPEPRPRPEFEDLERLVERARAGDDLALNELFGILGPAALSFAQAEIMKRQWIGVQASDISQNVLLIASEKVRRGEFELRRPNGLWAWLRTIVKRQVHDEVKRHRPEVQLATGQDRAAAHTSPSVTLQRAEGQRLREECLASLGPADREILVLRERGATFEEVAAALGKSTAHAAEVAYYRAEARLNEYLRRRAGGST